jgi:nitric oxide reductase subunit B
MTGPKPDTAYTDRAAKAFLVFAMSYLLLGLLFGTLGGFQYLLPALWKDKLSFAKTRPLHVYLVISWIFSAAQAGIYYYLPRLTGRRLYWKRGPWVHLYMQSGITVLIITSFFMGRFGGREYLEFPPVFGFLIVLAWLPFVINFFFTLKPNFNTAPVYIWSWSTGIVFFFITLSESYLWVFDYFKTNIVRDITVQWKALGSMVGSWNMLVYGTAMFVMEKISGNTKTCRSRESFFLYFLGLANLMFNWGHHTYIVPAAPWVKTVSYVISMTELLILGHIIWQWKRTLTGAIKNYYSIPYRLLSYADLWIFLNLTLALIISVPAWNYYTHGTTITVAHAMGTTIGINTLLLFASVLYILKQEKPFSFEKKRRLFSSGILITNISLLVFWISLLGSGLVKIAGKLNNKTFSTIMEESKPFFRGFTFSGVFIMAGLLFLIMPAIRLLVKPRRTVATEVKSIPSQVLIRDQVPV